ncbi:MAG: helix-turn-helix transcriptional regulator [Lachnospiraceae bacterium]|nr:helix-turn-helix transcriptional regulator [Lachnospiraceae bacterium]
MDNKEIGERIAKLRVEKRFSREALARNIGISTKFLYEIESGKKNFSVWILYKISQLLSVSCDYLITGKKNPEL